MIKADLILLELYNLLLYNKKGHLILNHSENLVFTM